MGSKLRKSASSDFVWKKSSSKEIVGRTRSLFTEETFRNILLFFCSFPPWLEWMTEKLREQERKERPQNEIWLLSDNLTHPINFAFNFRVVHFALLSIEQSCLPSSIVLAPMQLKIRHVTDRLNRVVRGEVVLNKDTPRYNFCTCIIASKCGDALARSFNFLKATHLTKHPSSSMQSS